MLKRLLIERAVTTDKKKIAHNERRGPVYMDQVGRSQKTNPKFVKGWPLRRGAFFELAVWLFVWTDHLKLNGLGGAFWLFGHLG